jgi:hypothetical protein
MRSMRKIKVVHPQHVQFSQRLNVVPVGETWINVEDLRQELYEMFDILLGRKESPISSPYLAMAEVATAYYTRAQEVDALIHRGEQEGTILRGSDLYRFRTGELRSFIDAAKRCAELGSRRLTQEQLLHNQREVT